MARVLISYDIEKVKGVHDFVKDEMIEKGYFDCFLTKTAEKYYFHSLPNTTLWHPNTTTTQSRQDIKDALNKFQTNGDKLLEKSISTNIVDFRSYCRDSKLATAKEILTIPVM